MSPLSLGVAGTTAVTPRAALPSLRLCSKTAGQVLRRHREGLGGGRV